MKVDKIGYMTEEKGNERFNKSSTLMLYTFS